MKITLFGTQPYDRESFDRIRDTYGFDICYHRSHLNANNVVLAQGEDQTTEELPVIGAQGMTNHDR